jgi:hypothetical protein
MTELLALARLQALMAQTCLHSSQICSGKARFALIA